jgi:hypothetical protein
MLQIHTFWLYVAHLHIGNRCVVPANYVKLTGEMNACRILVGKSEGKRAWSRWEDNIKMNLGSGLDSPGSGYVPVAGCCKHGKETPGSIKEENFLPI